MFLIILSIAIFVVWFYILFLREWLVALWPGRFTRIREWEIWLWENSRQILLSRLYWVGGILVFAHDQLANLGFDVTPILTEVGNFVPEKWRALVLALVLGVTGVAFEWLRRQTTEPLKVKTEPIPVTGPDAGADLMLQVSHVDSGGETTDGDSGH